MLSLPRFGHFLARKMAAGKSATFRSVAVCSSETATAFLSFSRSWFWGRGCDKTLFRAKKVFSIKKGGCIQWMRWGRLVMISTRKPCNEPPDFENWKLLFSSPSRRSALCEGSPSYVRRSQITTYATLPGCLEWKFSLRVLFTIGSLSFFVYCYALGFCYLLEVRNGLFRNYLFFALKMLRVEGGVQKW